MKKKRLRTALCIALAAAGLTAFGALAAGGAGSQSDPLVTLSYLTDTFTGQIMDKVDASIAGRDARLLQELGGSAVSGAASAYTPDKLCTGRRAARCCCAPARPAAAHPQSRDWWTLRQAAASPAGRPFRQITSTS